MQINTTGRVLPLLGLLCAAYLSVFIVLGFYAQPVVDDFDFANKLLNEGFVESQISWYTGWTGRYASSALISLFIMGSNLINDYWQVPVLLILCTPLAFASIIYFLAEEKLSVWQSFNWGLFFTCLYLAGIPSTAETFYWLSGGITYQLGNILFLTLTATVVNMAYNPSGTWVAKLRFIFACILVMAVAGMNETIMSAEILFLMIMMLICFINKGKGRAMYLTLFLISLASFTIVLLAPGNEKRLSCFPNAHNLSFSLWSSIKKGAVDTACWGLTPSLLIATVIAVPTAISCIESIRPGYKFGKNAIAFIFIGWMLMVSLYFPSFYSMGTAPPLRTHSVMYVIFIFWWFYSVTVIYSLYTNYHKNISYSLSLMLVFALGVSLFFTGNGNIALKDMGKGRRFHAEYQSRYKVIRKAKAAGKEDIQVPALTQFPWTIYVNDITCNSADWRNTPCAKYFGVHSIAATTKFGQTDSCGF